MTNSTAHTGVWASGGSVANNAAAVHGQSTGGNGLEGISGKNTASGVYGQNNSTGFGVAGRAPSGVGVMGDSSGGWAMQAFGNASQTRTGNGFVKAMAFFDPVNHPSDPIQQCFNSRRPASMATNGNCGISYTKSQAGNYELDFGFQVSDRLVSATSAFASSTIGVAPDPSNNTKLFVSIWDTFQNVGYHDHPLYILVY